MALRIEDRDALAKVRKRPLVSFSNEVSERPLPAFRAAPSAVPRLPLIDRPIVEASASIANRAEAGRGTSEPLCSCEESLSPAAYAANFAVDAQSRFNVGVVGLAPGEIRRFAPPRNASAHEH